MNKPFTKIISCIVFIVFTSQNVSALAPSGQIHKINSDINVLISRIENFDCDRDELPNLIWPKNVKAKTLDFVSQCISGLPPEKGIRIRKKFMFVIMCSTLGITDIKLLKALMNMFVADNQNGIPPQYHAGKVFDLSRSLFPDRNLPAEIERLLSRIERAVQRRNQYNRFIPIIREFKHKCNYFRGQQLAVEKAEAAHPDTPPSQSEIEEFLGVKLTDEDDLLYAKEVCVRLTEDLLVFRIAPAATLSFIAETGGILSNAGARPGNTRIYPKSDKREISRSILRNRLFYKTLRKIVGDDSVDGQNRNSTGDPFISTSTDLAFIEHLRGEYPGDSVVYMIRVPKGQLVLDHIQGHEAIVLLPHYIPKGWISAVFQSNEEYYAEIRQYHKDIVKDINFVEAGNFGKDTLALKSRGISNSKCAIHAGDKDDIILSFNAGKNPVENLGGLRDRWYKFEAGASIEANLLSMPRLNALYSRNKEHFEFYVNDGEADPGHILRSGDRLIIKVSPELCAVLEMKEKIIANKTIGENDAAEFLRNARIILNNEEKYSQGVLEDIVFVSFFLLFENKWIFEEDKLKNSMTEILSQLFPALESMLYNSADRLTILSRLYCFMFLSEKDIENSFAILKPHAEMLFDCLNDPITASGALDCLIYLAKRGAITIDRLETAIKSRKLARGILRPIVKAVKALDKSRDIPETAV